MERSHPRARVDAPGWPPALLLLAVACAPAPAGPPPPPRPGPELRLDPALRTALEEALAAIESEPEQVLPRMELAMSFDANALHRLALEAYSQVIELEPTRARAWHHRGRVKDELGDPEGALGDLERAQELRKDYAPSRWRRGRLLLDLGRLDAAEAAFHEVVRLQSGDPSGAAGLAHIALERDQTEAALEVLAPALERFPRDPELRRLWIRALHQGGQAERARQAAAEPVDRTSRVWADPWAAEVFAFQAGRRDTMARARQLLRAGDEEAALELLAPLLEEQPADITVQGMMTAAWAQLGDLESALELCEQTSRIVPNHAQLELNWGVLLSLDDRQAEALPHLERAVELNPASSPAQAKLGEVLSLQGEWESARERLENALWLRPDHGPILLLLARAELELGDHEKAREHLHAAALSPGLAADAQAALVEAQLALGEVEAARRAWAELERAAPSDPRLADLRRKIDAVGEQP